MNKVLKLQRVGLMTPTVVEYAGKVLATNQLDIESTCNLWRSHFGFYPTEKIYLAMTKKEFSAIQQKTLSYVRSVYDLFYEQNFIPREFEANEEHTEWGMYRNKEIETLKSENATLRERLGKAVVNGKRFIVEKEIDGREAYVVCRYKVIKSYICTEYTREAAEARLAELKGEKKNG